MSSSKNIDIKKNSFLNKSNSEFIEQMYLKFIKKDPTLPQSWKDYFKDLDEDSNLIINEINGQVLANGGANNGSPIWDFTVPATELQQSNFILTTDGEACSDEFFIYTYKGENSSVFYNSTILYGLFNFISINFDYFWFLD